MNSENLLVDESEWVSGGPDRFYSNQAYNAKTQTFDDLPSKAASVGSKGKVSQFLTYSFPKKLRFGFFAIEQ